MFNNFLLAGDGSSTVGYSNVYGWGASAFYQIWDGTYSVATRSSPVLISGTWKKVVNGGEAAAAIKTDGTLWGWGRNSSGQVGDNTTIDRSSPVQISASKFKDLVAGNNFFVALDYNSKIYTWGLNTVGQLGDITTINRSSPVQVPGSWNSINASGSAASAIRSDSTLWAWGLNNNNQLGDNSGTNRSSPVQVTNKSYIYATTNYIWYAPSYRTIHYIDSNYQLYALGNNSIGMIGNGGTGSGALTETAINVGASYNFVHAGASHVVALRTNGTLWGWGYNGTYALGDGTTILRNAPTQVAGSWTAVLASNLGGGHTVAIDSANNGLWVWGSGYGTTPYGSASYKSPMQIGYNVSGTAKFYRAIATDDYYCAAIKDDYTLWMWGGSDKGQLGQSTTIDRSSPTQVGGSWNFVSIGNYVEKIAAAIRTDGKLFIWGSNNLGQLGDSTTVNKSSPIQVKSGTSFNFVATGPSHTMAIDSTYKLWGFGYNAYGQVGDNTTINKSSPVQVLAGTSFVYVGVSFDSSYAIDTVGKLYAWGRNHVGQLGDNTTINKSSPIQIAGGSSFTIVKAGISTATAIDINGRLWAWGENSQGSVGDGTTLQRSSPVLISSSSYTQVAHSYSGRQYWALRSDGTVWATGENTTSQPLGDDWSTDPTGSLGRRSSLTQVYAVSSVALLSVQGLVRSDQPGVLKLIGSSGSGRFAWQNNNTVTIYNFLFDYVPLNFYSYTAIATKHSAVAALRSDGTVWGWGANSGGEIKPKYGPYSVYYSPVQIFAGSSFTAIAGNDTNFFGLTVDGRVIASGYNHPSGGFLGFKGLGHGRYTSNWDTWTYCNDINGFDVLYSQDLSVKQISSRTVINYESIFVVDNNDDLWFKGYDGYGESLSFNVDLDVIAATQLSRPTFSYFRKLPGKWSKFAGHNIHKVGIRTDGTIWGWGYNGNGELAQTLGALTNRSSPVQIGTANNWTDIVTGSATTFALNSLGQLWAWGYNGDGRLGDTTTISRSSPVQLMAGTSFVLVKARAAGALALDTLGKLWTWGTNDQGQLGDSTTVNKSSPIQVKSGTSFTFMSAGQYHNIAIDTGGQAWGWGYNGRGALGDNSTINRSSPVLVGISGIAGTALASQWVSVWCSANHTSILFDSEGKAFVTGYMADRMNGKTATSRASVQSAELAPTELNIGTNIAGYANNIYNYSGSAGAPIPWPKLLEFSKTYPLGPNNFGTENNSDSGTYDQPFVFIKDPSQNNKLAVAGWHGGVYVPYDALVGHYNYNIVDTNLSLPSWEGSWTSLGLTKWNQLGAYGGFANNVNGLQYHWNAAITNSNNTLQTLPNGLAPFTSISQIQNLNIGVDVYGNLLQWGTDNSTGVWGKNDRLDTQITKPTVTRTGIQKFKSASIGESVGVAIGADDYVYWWGNVFGKGSPVSIQSGYKNTEDYYMQHYKYITASEGSIFGINYDGLLMGWGRIGGFRPPILTNTVQSSPTIIGSSAKWKQVYAIGSTVAADVSYTIIGIKADGTLWSWGKNSYGLAGDNATAAWKTTPVQIGTSNKWVSIFASSTRDSATVFVSSR
jgi:alpha-tubulin suppressor-like RCC1 family protein